MPLIDFTAATSSPPDIFLKSVEKLAGTTITGWGPSVTYLSNGSFAYEFKGSGLTYALVDGIRVMTGGEITSIQVRYDLVVVMDLGGLFLDADALQAAIGADAAGTDNAALETLFLPLGWSYAGKSGRDVLMTGGLSSDGAALNLAGNDTVSLGGGNDDCALGSGDDIGTGGAGQDGLDGGRGRDSLAGDGGNDTVLGGIGADLLSGGADNDTLDGGSEGDRLSGGKGADTLTGGTGADVFAFALRAGQDQITDFDIATDRIDLAGAVSHHFTAAGDDVLLTYGRGGDQVLLIGIDISASGGIVIL